MSEGQQATAEGGAGGATPVSPQDGGAVAAGPRAVRLGGLLQDLLAARGRRNTAELLGVSERTLQRADAEGRLTEQLCRALERYEAGLVEASGSGEPGAQPVDAVDNWRELARLTRRVDKLEEVITDRLPEVQAALTRLDASVEELREQVGALQNVNGGDAGRSAASAATRTTRTNTGTSRIRLPRYPELVTGQATPGESRVYGAARSVIVDWRRARQRRERASTKLGRLKADERLLELELVLVGEHGLTLPPADRPWDGIRRQSELRVLDQALRRVRRERRRTQLWHWVLRLLTLGLWGLLERRGWARRR